MLEENNVEAFIEANITRIEVIWDEREYVKYWKFEASIQDGWKTLKIFIKK
jgi:hypothetical protein